MTIENINEIDKQILDLLQKDAKITIKEISNLFGKSQTAVRS
ncbi:MAG: AsnC family protein [Promethearchaeota archaeon]